MVEKMEEGEMEEALEEVETGKEMEQAQPRSMKEHLEEAHAAPPKIMPAAASKTTPASTFTDFIFSDTTPVPAKPSPFDMTPPTSPPESAPKRGSLGGVGGGKKGGSATLPAKPPPFDMIPLSSPPPQTGRGWGGGEAGGGSSSKSIFDTPAFNLSAKPAPAKPSPFDMTPPRAPGPRGWGGGRGEGGGGGEGWGGVGNKHGGAPLLKTPVVRGWDEVDLVW